MQEYSFDKFIFIGFLLPILGFDYEVPWGILIIYWSLRDIDLFLAWVYHIPWEYCYITLSDFSNRSWYATHFILIVY
jgi:hypothetical protein